MCAAYVPPPEEPSSEVVLSGQCKVPVCADIDFGNYSFRYYSPDRTMHVRFIPKDACECQKIRRIEGDYIKLSVETRDGKTAPNVSMLRIYPRPSACKQRQYDDMATILPKQERRRRDR